MNMSALTVIVIIIIVGGVFIAYKLLTRSQRVVEQNSNEDNKILQVTVDYNKSFDQMFNHDTYGEGFSAEDPRIDITPQNFPVSGSGTSEVEIELVKFGEQENITYDDVLTKLAERGLEPARIEHLFAIHDQYPDLSLFNQGYIYGLGSVWQEINDGNTVRRVPALATEQPHILRAAWMDAADGTPTGINTLDDWFAVIRK